MCPPEIVLDVRLTLVSILLSSKDNGNQLFSLYSGDYEFPLFELYWEVLGSTFKRPLKDIDRVN